MPPKASAGDDQTVTADDRSRSAAPQVAGAAGRRLLWTFGDGDAATGPTASHVYPTPGTYTATLTVLQQAAAASSTAPSCRCSGRRLPLPPPWSPTVRDEAGAAVGGATVVIELADGTRRTAVTSASGIARFTGLADGRYRAYAPRGDRAR